MNVHEDIGAEIGDIGLTGPLRGEILEDGRRMRLLYPFRVKVPELEGRILEVPAGFVTDFASVPRFFWRVLPPWGRYSPAAVVHDYLYQTGRVPRETADRIFLALMKQLDVGLVTRQIMYRAVRLFGSGAWKHAREQEQERREQHREPEHAEARP